MGWRALAATAGGWLRARLEHERAHRTPFLWLPVAFALGILAYFAAPEEPAAWSGWLLAVLLVAPALRADGVARALLLAGGFAALGFAFATLRTVHMAAPMLERSGNYVVQGFVEQLDQQPRRHRLTLRVSAIEGIDAARLPHRLRIGAPGRAQVEPGGFIKLSARLSPPSEAAMPGGYDFRRAAFFSATGGVGFATGRIERADPPGPAPFWLAFHARIDRLRNAMTERIARAIGGEAGALSAALVTGKRGLIGEETNEQLRASGLYHIVSISGLHMVLAAGVLFWLARALLAAIPRVALAWPVKKLAALVAMAGASFYCLFSGSEVATERALIMTLVMLGAILFDRPALAMRNLAISALLVMAREPEAILGPSFQMSFAAVAGLIAANQIWQDWRKGRPPSERGPLGRGFHRIAMAFAAIVATTIVASLATAPFSAFHFHRLNPFGLIGNSLAIPLVSLIVMPAGVAGALAYPFGLDGLVWQVMGQGVAGVLFVADLVSRLDNAVLPVARVSRLSFVLLVAAMLVFVCLRSALRLAALPLLLIWLISLNATPLPDIVVDPSARMALIRGEGGRYRLLAPASPNAFTLNQWLPALGDARTPRDPSLRQGVRCDAAGCVGRLADGRLVALAIRLDALRQDCRRADIVITPLAGATLCAAPRRLIDRTHAERHGATMIRTASPEHWRLETTLDPDRPRPWRRAIAASPTPTQPAPLQAAAEAPSRPAGPGEDPGIAPQ